MASGINFSVIACSYYLDVKIEFLYSVGFVFNEHFCSSHKADKNPYDKDYDVAC